MRAVRTWCLLVLAGGALTLAGCAAKGGTGAEAGTAAAATEGAFQVPIEVDNNLSALTGVTVYVQRQGGTNRRMLGMVESGQKRTFEYDAREGTFQLLARRGGGQSDIVSELFQLSTGMGVQWSLGNNRLLLRR